MARYWYFITYHYCPQCCGSVTYRERRYTERPEDYWERHEEKEVYDYCG